MRWQADTGGFELARLLSRRADHLAPVDPRAGRSPVVVVGSVLLSIVVVVAAIVRWRTLASIGLAALVFVPIERLWPSQPGRALRRGISIDVVALLVNSLLKSVMTVVAVTLAGAPLRHLTPGAVRGWIGDSPWWRQAVLAFALSELASYWWHRLAHRIPWWWRFHKMHHSIANLDWLAAARAHPVDRALENWFLVVPLYALGFSPSVLGLFGAVFAVQGFFVHANVRFRFGWLRHVVVTPEYHRWHHSTDPRAHDSNFAGKLPILDRIFRTQYSAGDRVPEEFGIDEPVPTTYLGQLLWPFLGVADRSDPATVARGTMHEV